MIIYEDHRASLVHTHLWYRIGSNQELPGQTGLSHAVEHMLFNGSSKLCTGESGHILQNLGGSQNAMTLNDATLFFHTSVDTSALPLRFAGGPDHVASQ